MSTTTPNMQRKSSLGISAKFSSTGRKSDSAKTENAKDSAIKQRFKLQRKAQKLLPNERIANCHRAPTQNAAYVTGWHNPDLDLAGFGNLQTCGSYSCPVCAHKKTEQDRRMLSVALAQATKKGYFPVMITFTLSHHKGNTLDQTFDTLKIAFDETFSGRWYQEFQDAWKVVGKIRAVEATYGLNGWHPHFHVLMFFEMEWAGKWIVKLQGEIYEQYVKMLKKHGFFADSVHGVDVRTAESDIADYIAKFGHEPAVKSWGIDSEIGYAQKKKAARDGLTPFQLLGASCGDSGALAQLAFTHSLENPTDAIPIAERLYIEFFHAMKGSARIFWSKGLKELLGVEEMLADVQAEEADLSETTEELVFIETGENWHKVTGKHESEDLRAELLVLLRTGDKLKIHEWLEYHAIKHIIL